MENKKCKCGENTMGENSDSCYRCWNEYWEQRDKDFPFVVRMGNGDHESFKTRKEADEFCDQMRSSYVTTR